MAVAAALLLAACSSSSGNVVKPPASGATSFSSTPVSTPPSSSTPAASSSVHGSPRITITPNSALAARQEVQIVGSGFTAGEQLQVIECADKGTSTGPSDCDLSGSKSVAADASGAVRVTLTVSRGPFGGNNIVCGATQKCLVSVTQASLQPTEEADAPISFTG